MICNEDGTAWEQFEVCDGLQGLSCNQDSGTCDGACSQAQIGLSYIGCDYYPTVTKQHDSYNSAPKDAFAVAVANTGNQDAMVIITQGDAMIYDTVVAAKPKYTLLLPVAEIAREHGVIEANTDATLLRGGEDEVLAHLGVERV